MLQDLRLIFRSLSRDKAFTFGVIATLALVIGGNASVFTVVRSVLLRPLPMTRPNELVSIALVRRESNEYPLNLWAFSNFQKRNRTLAEMSALTSFNANLSGESDPERIPGVRVTANYFTMIGLKALAGRPLLPEDDTPGRNKVVVLTSGLWQRRYGGDAHIIGTTIRLNGEPYLVVGILPPEFAFSYNTAEFAAPLSPTSDPARDRPNAIASLRVTARIKSGAGVKATQDDLKGVVADMRKQYPESAAWLDARVLPLSEQMTANARPLLLLIMTAVLLVLLIACANIAGLILSRAATRRQELCVRMALGAGRARLLRQFTLESGMLAGMGGLVGLALAKVSLPLLLQMSPANLPRANEIRLDFTVLASVAAAVCGIAVLFGTLVAMYTSHDSLGAGLRSQARSGTAARSQNRARNVFVVAEIALALVLLVAAGLVMRSFIELRRVTIGFEPGHLLTTRLSLPAQRYKTAGDVASFQRQLAPAIASIPGVISNGAISILPLSGPLATVDFDIAGRPRHSDGERPVADYRMIDAGYLSTIGQRVVEGRSFNASDTAESRAVALINQALARQQWPTGGAVGGHLLTRDAGALRDLEIVGVVSDVRANSLTSDPQPTIFVHIPQVPAAPVRFLANSMFWVVRTATPPGTLAKALGDAIHKIDSEIAASNRVGMEFYLDRALAEEHFTLRLLLVFALFALVLSAQGIYALISHVFAQHMREIGIRLALGAAPTQVARLITGYGARLVVPGLALGLAVCAALTRLVSSLLYKVRPWDPITIGIVAALLALTGLAATLVPARRSMRVDPAIALRD
jgi:putative ABC transport system permease protein